MQNYDDGSSERPYGHALLAGVDRYPLKVTRAMGKKKVAQRSKIKPFVKVINYNHLMPTRYVHAKRKAASVHRGKTASFSYSVDITFDKGTVNKDCLKDVSRKRKAKRDVKQKMEERYASF